MRTRPIKRSESRLKASLLAVFVCVFCVFGALGLIGCTTSTQNSSNSEDATSESDDIVMNSEEVSGTIKEILETELLVEISESTAAGLQLGLVRVDISQIDSDTINNLEVGDTITFEFSGVMGMSEPPFVSANSLELSK